MNADREFVAVHRRKPACQCASRFPDRNGNDVGIQQIPDLRHGRKTSSDRTGGSGISANSSAIGSSCGRNLGQRALPLHRLDDKTVVLSVEDDLIGGKLQVARDPQRLIAPVAKQASATRRLRCMSFLMARHMISICRLPQTVQRRSGRRWRRSTLTSRTRLRSSPRSSRCRCSPADTVGRHATRTGCSRRTPGTDLSGLRSRPSPADAPGACCSMSLLQRVQEQALAEIGT